MKKFLYKLLLLIVLESIIILGYCKLADLARKKYLGINTEEKIDKSFCQSIIGGYNCYFLGNSRIYRGVNPELFTHVKAYNFGHDNDSYNQMYYKLKYLLDEGQTIDYLVIGTDYFQFSFLDNSRNYIYKKYFPKEYLYDYENTSIISNVAVDLTNIWNSKQNLLPACVKYIKNEPTPDGVPYQKDNGQYVIGGHATGEEAIDRDYSILETQYCYYKKIIDICTLNDIELYIVMPPLWEAEVASHDERDRDAFNHMIEQSLEHTQFIGNYINYSELEGLSSYKDFIDITHLTPEAADTFSTYLNDYIWNSK